MKKLRLGLTEEQLNKFFEAVEGLTYAQWSELSRLLEYRYSTEATKTTLDDFDKVKASFIRELRL